eukprot:11422-Heterococcus_DN1.PRE.7
MGTLQSKPVQPVLWGSPFGSLNRGRPPPWRPSTHCVDHCLHCPSRYVVSGSDSGNSSSGSSSVSGVVVVMCSAVA